MFWKFIYIRFEAQKYNFVGLPVSVVAGAAASPAARAAGCWRCSDPARGATAQRGPVYWWAGGGGADSRARTSGSVGSSSLW